MQISYIPATISIGILVDNGNIQIPNCFLVKNHKDAIWITLAIIMVMTKMREVLKYFMLIADTKQIMGTNIVQNSQMVV